MFNLMKKIVDEIRMAIRAGGKSRYRLSKEADIPQSQLSRLMTGEKALSLESLERLMDALDLEFVIRPKTTNKRKVKYGKRD